MEPTIDQVLLARAIKDSQSQPTYTDAALMGGLPGAAVGALAGDGVIKLGNLINNAKDRIAAGRGLVPVKPSLLSQIKPGRRAAGGLVGLIAGGGLGMAAKAMMANESLAGELLSKRQTQGGLSAEDNAKLQMLLAETYNQMGIG